MPPPVKELALQHGLTVYQPTTLRDDEVQQLIADLQPELIVVVAYGKLLSKAVLDIPPRGCVNVHGSLLPKYRGAAAHSVDRIKRRCNCRRNHNVYG